MNLIRKTVPALIALLLVAGAAGATSFTVASSIANGQTLSGKLRWTATVSGIPTTDISTVEFFVDGSRKTIEKSAPYSYGGDQGLLAAARRVRGTYHKGRVVEGVIGSSEIWNSEIDRIQRFHDQFGTTAEEMETASAAQIAGLFQIPFLGIRVVSNNITNGGAYDAGTGEACQEYVVEVVKGYVGGKLKRQ